MCSGVGKSGSPAPNPITSLPAAFMALAVASTASVADGAMLRIRAEMRDMLESLHGRAIRPRPLPPGPGLRQPAPGPPIADRRAARPAGRGVQRAPFHVQ